MFDIYLLDTILGVILVYFGGFWWFLVFMVIFVELYLNRILVLFCLFESNWVLFCVFGNSCLRFLGVYLALG